MSCIIPDECKLDLWAKVIIAKNIQTNEPILGSYDAYGNPVPYHLVLTPSDLGDATAVCIEDIKVTPTSQNETFVCNSKVTVTLTYDILFLIKTTTGYITKTVSVTASNPFTKTILVGDFIKLDGTPLTSAEFKCDVDQSELIMCNFDLAYVDVKPKDPVSGNQTIDVIVTATIIDKLGKMRDVLVYGVVEDLGCIC